MEEKKSPPKKRKTKIKIEKLYSKNNYMMSSTNS